MGPPPWQASRGLTPATRGPGWPSETRRAAWVALFHATSTAAGGAGRSPRNQQADVGRGNGPHPQIPTATALSSTWRPPPHATVGPKGHSINTASFIIVDFVELLNERITYIYGRPGAGRTAFAVGVAVQLVSRRKKVVWVTFNERRELVERQWQAFGRLGDAVAIYDLPRVSQYRETLFGQVVDLAYREKADALFVDGVSAMIYDDISASSVTKMGIGTVVGIDVPPDNPLAQVADVVLKMDVAFTSYAAIRKITVVKTRGMSVEKPVYYIAMSPRGPVVVKERHEEAGEAVWRPAPGRLRELLGEVPLGSQIALYGASSTKAMTALVDDDEALAYIHMPYQAVLFSRARVRRVSIYEHMRLESYVEPPGKPYVVTLDADYLAPWFRRFRSWNAIWVDIYAERPRGLYDYVVKVQGGGAVVERSLMPPVVSELRQ